MRRNRAGTAIIAVCAFGLTVVPSVMGQAGQGDLTVQVTPNALELLPNTTRSATLRVTGTARCPTSPGPAAVYASKTGEDGQGPIAWHLSPADVAPRANQSQSDPSLWTIDSSYALMVTSNKTISNDVWENVTWLGSRGGSQCYPGFRWAVVSSSTLAIHVRRSTFAETGVDAAPSAPGLTGSAETPIEAYVSLGIVSVVVVALAFWFRKRGS